MAIPVNARKDIKYGLELTLAISPDERFMALGTGLGNRLNYYFRFQIGNGQGSAHARSSLDRACFSKSSRYLFANGNEVRNVVWGNGVLDIWDTESWKLLREIEVKEWEICPVLEIQNQGMVLSVDSLRKPEERRP